MCQIFKNMIILERGNKTDINDYIKKFAYFEERKPFEYHSPEDKIILFSIKKT